MSTDGLAPWPLSKYQLFWGFGCCLKFRLRLSSGCISSLSQYLSKCQVCFYEVCSSYDIKQETKGWMFTATISGLKVFHLRIYVSVFSVKGVARRGGRQNTRLQIFQLRSEFLGKTWPPAKCTDSEYVRLWDLRCLLTPSTTINHI